MIHKCDYCKKVIDTETSRRFSYRYSDPNDMCGWVDTKIVFVCDDEYCCENTLYKYEYEGIKELRNATD